MHKKELLRLLAKRTGLSIADTKYVWKEFEEIIKEQIQKREEVHIRGFGHLYYSERKASRHHNIMTGEIVEPNSENIYSLGFRLSRDLKDLLIEDPTKRRIYQTRQAELKRSGLIPLDDDDLEDALEQKDKNDSEQ